MVTGLDGVSLLSSSQVSFFIAAMAVVVACRLLQTAGWHPGGDTWEVTTESSFSVVIMTCTRYTGIKYVITHWWQWYQPLSECTSVTWFCSSIKLIWCEMKKQILFKNNLRGWRGRPGIAHSVSNYPGIRRRLAYVMGEEVSQLRLQFAETLNKERYCENWEVEYVRKLALGDITHFVSFVWRQVLLGYWRMIFKMNSETGNRFMNHELATLYYNL